MSDEEQTQPAGEHSDAGQLEAAKPHRVIGTPSPVAARTLLDPDLPAGSGGRTLLDPAVRPGGRTPRT